MLAADPVVSWMEPMKSGMIGEEVAVSLSFDNASSTDTGYGPYIDVLIPESAGGIALTPLSPSYLDAPIEHHVFTIDADGYASHPYAVDENGAPLAVEGTPGDKLLVMRLPYGGFVADQPAQTVDFSLRLSPDVSLDDRLVLSANGGFQFGGTAIHDPASDPSIFGAAQELTILPQVFDTRLDYLGPESETATGPSFERTYRVTVDVASGQTIDDAIATVTLPDNLVFVGARADDVAQESVAIETLEDGAQVVTVDLGSVAGGAGASDAVALLDFYVPQLDASSSEIIDPSTGDDALSVTSLVVGARWSYDDLDEETPPRIYVLQSTDQHSLSDQSIAVQEHVSMLSVGDLSPGSVLEHRLDFQVSDFFAFDDVTLEGLIADGLRIDASQLPVLTLPTLGYSGAMAVENYTLTEHWQASSTAAAPLDGSHRIEARVSDELRSRGLSGVLVGAAYSQEGPVTGSLTFRTVVQDNFAEDYPSGEGVVDEGDRLHSNALVTGQLLDPVTLQSIESLESDDSGSALTLPFGDLAMSIYAINGQTAFTEPRVSPGDEVTFRFRREVLHGDVEDLALTAYLPIPLVEAIEIDAFALAPTTAPPHSGSATLGPTDTLHERLGATPGLTVDASANRVRFDYGDVGDELNRDSMIDLLVTLTATDTPFADGLLLTSHAHARQGTTNAGSHTDNALVQVIVAQPELHLTKGVIDADNPAVLFLNGAGGMPDIVTSDSLSLSPVDADVARLDAGDRVRLAIVVENRGSSQHGAFDVRVRDVLPEGLLIPEGGLNLSVANGHGEAMAFTELPGGLFGEGIELIDGESGSLAKHSSGSGDNLVVIQYDAVVKNDVVAREELVGTAFVTNYAGVEGGQDHTAEDLPDSATVKIDDLTLNVVLKQTGLDSTPGTNVAIGETVTYEATITLPEGEVDDLEFVGTLSRGLAIVSIDSIEASGELLAESQLAEALASAQIESVGSGEPNEGRRWRIGLGDVSNTNRDNESPETVVVTYTAVVTNFSSNDQGDRRQSRVDASWAGGSLRDDAEKVRIVEPRIEVKKTIGAETGDAGDTVTVSLRVDHHRRSGADAHDLVLSDTIAEGARLVDGSLRWSGGGEEPDTLGIDAQGNIIASWDSLNTEQSSLVQYEVVLDDLVSAGQSLASPAEVTWTGLEGDPGTLSQHNPLAVERTSDGARPGGAANDYRKVDRGLFVVAAPTITKSVIATSAEHTSDEHVTIGESVSYLVEVAVPEGRHALRLDDFFPNDAFELESANVVHIGANLQGVETTPALNGAGFTIDLGQVTNAPDGVVTDDDRLRLRVDLRVLDRDSVHDGGVLLNRAVIDYDSGQKEATAAVSVVEPKLIIDKQVNASSADALDVLRYTITVRHHEDSHADAFGIRVDDFIDTEHLQVDLDSLQVNVNDTVAAVAEDAITAEFGRLAIGEELVISFSAALTSDADPGENIENGSSARWESLSGEGRAYQASDAVTTRINSTSLVGSVFVDANGDGVVDLGDLGIPHAEVRITGVNHLGESVSRLIEADCDGRFLAEGLRPGDYTLSLVDSFQRPDGASYAGALGGEASTRTISSIAVASGSDGEYGEYRFTYRPWSGVSGSVFDDSNNDGVRQCEELGIEGVLITLTGVNDLGEQIYLTATTALDGTYDFGQLRAGDYSLHEEQPDGWLDGATDNSTQLALETGGATVKHFAELRPSSLSGFTYVDLDRDGVHDANDLALAGIAVTLVGNDDRGMTVQKTVQTSLGGSYAFVDLRPGRYTIVAEQPSAFTDGRETIGSFDGYPEPVARNGVVVQDAFSTIDLLPGERGYNYNFGELDDAHFPGILAEEYSEVIVFVGSASDDRFRFEAGLESHRVIFNGAEHAIDADETRSIRFFAGGGRDVVEMLGTQHEERAELRFGSSKIIGTSYELRAYSIEETYVHGGGGEDRAYLYDSAGDDRLEATDAMALLSGSGGQISQAIGFHRTYTSFSGGIDVASMHGSGQRDTFKATPTSARMYGQGFYNSVRGYDTIAAHAIGDGDRAHLWGGEGIDRLSVSQHASRQRGGSYEISTHGFSRIDAYSEAGQSDDAFLKGSDGDDAFHATPIEARLDSAGRRVVLHQYHEIAVDSGGGSNDRAFLYDSACVDTLVMSPEATRMHGDHFDHTALGFDRVYAHSTTGSADRAIFLDSSGDDVFKADALRARMYGSGFYNVAVGFEEVSAIASGGYDRAYLQDSTGDDVLVSSHEAVLFMGAGFSSMATGFDRIDAMAINGGLNRAYYTSGEVVSHSLTKGVVLRPVDASELRSQGFDCQASPVISKEDVALAYAELARAKNDELEQTSLEYAEKIAVFDEAYAL